MRQFQLREQKSFIKILKEPPNQKKKVNWSRRVYIMIFVAAALLVGRRVFNANMIIFADGQIDLPKQSVTFSNDIKILDLWILEGSSVCEGDTLFSYQVIGDELDRSLQVNKSVQTSDWVVRDRMATKRKIELSKLTISQSQQQIKMLQDMLLTQERLVLGGVHSAYDEYAQLRERISALEGDVRFRSEEIEILGKHLASLRAQEAAYSAQNQIRSEVYQEVRYFTAPLDGVISDVFYSVNEICYKKEEMITIHQLRDASINTYFDPEEIKHLEVGDVVEVEFPDKSTTRGVISKFFVSTYAVPSEFQKKYEPTERNVVAQVVPLNRSDELAWNSFYKMEVHVKKLRYDVGDVLL